MTTEIDDKVWPEVKLWLVLGFDNHAIELTVTDYGDRYEHDELGTFVYGSLFPTKKKAIERGIQCRRDLELRLYSERRALEVRLDEIEEAEVEVEQNLDGGDWDDINIERAGLKPPLLRTSSTKGYK